jgi:hypothetical protein
MTEDVKPIMNWDDMGFKDMCCWKTRLDNRYQIEVHRQSGNQDSGILYIWDHDDDMKLVHTKNIGHMMAGAIFGPDVDDVTSWQNEAIAFVDGKLPK